MPSKSSAETPPPDRKPGSDRDQAGNLPQTPAEQRNRDLRLGFLMHDVSRMRRRAFDEFMKPLGITRAQWWVIAHLSRHDGMMQTELATMLDVGKASLGTVVDRLETSGLIERRPHPVDRRAKSLFMTKKARDLIAKMRAAERTYNQIVLRDLGEDERNELFRLLEVVKHSLARMKLAASDEED
jgi:MarR family transcriptional regulator, transcriptional regulator for hemolysin